MSAVLDMAKQLGNALARTDEYQAFRRAMDASADDRDLVELRNRIEEIEAKVEASLRTGQEPPDDVKDAYGAAMEELQALGSYQRLVATQANFEKVMYKVNQTVAEGIEEGARSRIILSS